MGWEKKYPILKDYPDIVDKELIELFSKQTNNIIKELMSRHNLSLTDAVLIAKDIYYKEYLKIKG